MNANGRKLFAAIVILGIIPNICVYSRSFAAHQKEVSYEVYISIKIRYCTPTMQQSTYLNAMGIQVWRERAATPSSPEHTLAFYDANQQLAGFVLHDELPEAKQHAAMRLLDNILFSQGWQRGDKPSEQALDDQLPVLNFTSTGSLPTLSDLLDQPLRKREVFEHVNSRI